jgi:DHA1 family bicyclomycin/chloramphenicol resistance-like MFS transporter
LLLVLLSMVAPLSTDMFLPSMPAMARQFHTSPGTISLAVTLFIFSFAGAQLVWGPASDRFGRRPVLLSGLGLYVVGAALVAMASSAGQVVAGRVVQGIGGGSAFAVASAIVIDVYGRERALATLALMASVIGIAPMAAPTIGGLLQSAFGWRSVFIVFVVLGSVLVLGYLVLLPETVPSKDPRALRLGRLLGNCGRLFATPAFRSNVLLMTLLFSGQFVFISSSSPVFINQLGVSPRVYGLGFGSVALGMLLGANLTRRFGSRWDHKVAVRTATALGSTMAVSMALIALAGARGPLLILVPMFVFAACSGLVRPIAQAGALVPFPMMAGLASAVLGFTQMAGSSLVSGAFNGLATPNPASMTTVIACASLCGLLAGWVLARDRGTPAPETVPARAAGRSSAPDGDVDRRPEAAGRHPLSGPVHELHRLGGAEEVAQ